MNETRVAIVGITGRMGREIRSLASEYSFTVTGGVSDSSTQDMVGLGIATKIADLDPKRCDVVIDFSLPEITADVAAWCATHKKPLVTGVTGIDENAKGALEAAAKSTAVLWSPNMSLGVAVVARMLGHLQALADFDFQIEELHHNRKKDKPSGTAKLLQERLQNAVQTPLPEPVSIRGGGIFGIHTVWAMGEEEVITVQHTAMNRRVFARGALKAAAWLVGKPPRLYRMDEVL